MDAEKIGKAIKTLRLRAGYTQQELANRLLVSDKAVSRWERGVGVPDISLLRKLSVFLDADIDSLLEGNIAYQEDAWKGILFLDSFGTATVYDKPLYDYLLSYFLLVKIRTIIIVCNVEQHMTIEKRLGSGERIGAQLRYYVKSADQSMLDCFISIKDTYETNKIMAVFGSTVVYGVNFTRFLQKGLVSDHEITVLAYPSMKDQRQVFINENRRLMNECSPEVVFTQYKYTVLPILFLRKSIGEINPGEFDSFTELTDQLIRRESLYTELLDKGFVDFHIDNSKALLDASLFIQLVQQNTGCVVASLEEIAIRRGLSTITSILSKPETLTDPTYLRSLDL